MRVKLLILFISLFFLTGCGVLDTASNFISSVTGNKTNETGTTEEEAEQSADPIDVYSDLVTKTFDTSNEMLVRFNNALDMLYAGTATEEEFALILTDIIPESNKMIAELDSVLYNIDNQLYDFHRDLISLVNFQHEMFLKSLENANSPDTEVDKDKIRSEYVEIKQQQTILVQRIKEILTIILQSEVRQEQEK